ncbi:TATA box-binding protein-associated factor RNA polymerase I subunit D [Mustela nigripes]|uniref:TATA box-binding protein-associated factor RNA polymerase I subunit D n=2 Tax=Mustela putorius furo TaxID=9669 RepID=A0A8U0T0F3_MUSPF|nr:TATA box-binding protein-associated factor RNA polymerase I subunit D [Mustela putorius furo]XP_059042522.1 TATA box-binding protein-associated factor RNA polymerase I subunit D [Mustela lutreola]XP_059042560.1 TATA box-binding protein-associated factor RNA polymerase I subunit D [Mustela lutreola]XP_059042568.1 TATA box-binding protein-associated factor RNA polymerase I subunit D [Mustela lutreola]XP_059268714.1 TATA box-binding protein-associated factor RNA polymerase I subunit D [Mustela 
MASNSAVEIDSESDNSSGSSLFKTQCVPYSPKRVQRNRTRKFVHLPEVAQARDSSSDDSFEPRPLTLKAIFERFKNRKRKRKKKKYKPTGRPKGRPKGRKTSRRSQINKKQVQDKGSGFPFLESESARKPLPWRKILTFEQAVARGFFNYLEKLKYEYYLKESLKQMNVGEDLEKEDFDSRRYKYLDDDGALSPIEESETEDGSATNVEQNGECDIKLVDHNEFIISSQVPKMKNVYIEQEECTEEAALSKKRASKSKNIGQEYRMA